MKLYNLISGKKYLTPQHLCGDEAGLCLSSFQCNPIRSPIR